MTKKATLYCINAPIQYIDRYLDKIINLIMNWKITRYYRVSRSIWPQEWGSFLSCPLGSLFNPQLCVSYLKVIYACPWGPWEAFGDLLKSKNIQVRAPFLRPHRSGHPVDTFNMHVQCALCMGIGLISSLVVGRFLLPDLFGLLITD